MSTRLNQMEPNAADFEILCARLGYAFRDLGLLELALTHPSLAHESGSNIQNNQRLEYLGDAVLQLVITAELYLRFPEAAEGTLTKARAHLVNRSALAAQGSRLELGRHLLLSRGEETSGGRQRASTLADAFEATVGAVYLDGGMDEAKRLVLRQFHEPIGKLEQPPDLDNPKGELQEVLQAKSNEAPEYRLESSSGPDHNRLFICAVYHRGEALGHGEGRSKKEAESEAARAALTGLAPQPTEQG